MYARMITTQIKPGMLDEALDAFPGIAAAAQNVPGFNGLQMLVNRDSGKAVVIGLWETQEDEVASRAFLQERLGMMAPYMAGQPSVEVLEVGYQI